MSNQSSLSRVKKCSKQIPSELRRKPSGSPAKEREEGGSGRGLSSFSSLLSNQEEEAKKDPDEEEDEDVRKEQEKKFPRSSDSGSRGAPIGTPADPCAPTVDSIQRTTDRRNSYQRPSKKAWKQPWEKKTTIGTTRIQIQVLTVVLVVKRKHPRPKNPSPIVMIMVRRSRIRVAKNSSSK